ncbi:MAG: hypothetical protein EXR72_08430 [Myxococcales bacterium]|nr:hypothetical protein [Myxococcales bacterium]
MIAALGLCLFLPMLGSFGLWDPHEVKIADLAKEVAAAPALTPKAASARPQWLVVAGFKAFGIGEFGGRLPIALTAILALLACFYVGEGLLRRRAALLGTLALCTAPAFFLGARQLTTNVLSVLAMILAVGGLATAAWPKPGAGKAGRAIDLMVGLLGLLLGFFASGLMIGVAVPLTALAVALLAAGGAAGASAASLVAAATAWGVVIWAWNRGLSSPGHPAEYSAILAGTARLSSHQVDLVSVLKDIGFGIFPWAVLLPFAFARAVAVEERPAPTDGPAPGNDFARERFARVLLLAWLVMSYLGATLQAASVADVAFAGIGALALLAGWFLDEMLDEPARMPFAALGVFLGAAVLAHDFFLMPEKWAGAHVVEAIKWPSPLTITPYVLLGLGLVWGGLAAAGLAARPRAGLLGRASLLWLSMGAALVAAVVSTFWITPDVSKHLSYKNLFSAYKSLGGADGELCQYRVPGHGANYYNSGKVTEVGALPQLFDFLAKSSRVFCIVGADELAPIDQHAKSQPSGGEAKPLYYVVDDSNAHFLLVSNRLGANEQDKNALKRNIVRDLPRPPQYAIHADFEGKVELVGYDLPPQLTRGGKFKVTFYYKVNAAVGGAYKVFVHFDGSGTRFNGDHVPLDGRFPTNYWVPGFYIIDEHEMEPDRATAPSGNYKIYTGFWAGDQRLKVVTGNHDGENRVIVGSVQVK